MRRHVLLVAVAALGIVALALAGCGESDSEQAQDAVCEARAGIQTSVDDLRALAPPLPGSGRSALDLKFV